MGSLPEREYTDVEQEQMHRQTCPGCVSCLRAENARLQEQVKEAETKLRAAESTLRARGMGHLQHYELERARMRLWQDLETDRDRYKARDKLRGEALERIEDMAIDYVATDKAAGHIAKVAHAARNAPLEKEERDG
ncbi:hypothetical protein LCGC14_1184440 [marine sediment metagenome]|uniref:Uncharacterized protein n=1 Tax=marine sediment metagenome TaxID=412755 RepID=A0A0F9PRR4_9ZZZZ